MDDVKGVIHHIKDHQDYPATKEEMVAECENLMDFSDGDKKWFSENLPDKTYNSAEEVLKTLKLDD